MIGKPNLPAPPSQGIQLTWKGSMLVHEDWLADEYSDDVFMVAKPKISKKRQPLSSNSSQGNNFDSFVIRQTPIASTTNPRKSVPEPSLIFGLLGLMGFGLCIGNRA